MKKIVLVFMAAVLLLVANPVSANQFAEQYEKKLETRNKELGIETVSAVASYAAAVKIDGFINPAQGRFTSDFGWRDIGSGQEFHKGVDIANTTGTDIKASQGGQVIYSSAMGGYGKVVIINHTIKDKVYATVYAHLSLSNVLVGQTVKQGQSIAKMGSTGRSTGSHLHFEIHDGVWNGARSNAVDPAKYIDL